MAWPGHGTGRLCRASSPVQLIFDVRLLGIGFHPVRQIIMVRINLMAPYGAVALPFYAAINNLPLVNLMKYAALPKPEACRIPERIRLAGNMTLTAFICRYGQQSNLTNEDESLLSPPPAYVVGAPQRPAVVILRT